MLIPPFISPPTTICTAFQNHLVAPIPAIVPCRCQHQTRRRYCARLPPSACRNTNNTICHARPQAAQPPIWRVSPGAMWGVCLRSFWLVIHATAHFTSRPCLRGCRFETSNANRLHSQAVSRRGSVTAQMTPWQTRLEHSTRPHVMRGCKVRPDKRHRGRAFDVLGATDKPP